MQELYISRTLESKILRAVSEFPSVILLGPRQSGKTTLLKHLYPNREKPLISFELPDIRLAAEQDPRTFLRLHPSPVIRAGLRF